MSFENDLILAMKFIIVVYHFTEKGRQKATSEKLELGALPVGDKKKTCCSVSRVIQKGERHRKQGLSTLYKKH